MDTESNYMVLKRDENGRFFYQTHEFPMRLAWSPKRDLQYTEKFIQLEDEYLSKFREIGHGTLFHHMSMKFKTSEINYYDKVKIAKLWYELQHSSRMFNGASLRLAWRRCKKITYEYWEKERVLLNKLVEEESDFVKKSRDWDSNRLIWLNNVQGTFTRTHYLNRIVMEKPTYKDLEEDLLCKAYKVVEDYQNFKKFNNLIRF